MMGPSYCIRCFRSLDQESCRNEEIPLEQRNKLQVEFVLSRNTFTVLCRRPEASEGGEDECQATRGGAREWVGW